MASFAGLGGVADPRSTNEPDLIGTTRDLEEKLHEQERTHQQEHRNDQRRNSLMYTDSSISFEEYHYYANKSREYEKTIKPDAGLPGSILNVFIGKSQQQVDEGVAVPDHSSDNSSNDNIAKGPQEKSPRDDTARDDSPTTDKYGVTDSEYHNAQRAVRTATWGSVFYLITTDILGPYSVPWAISQMGYGPGSALYIVFGLLAAYSGTQLWKMFLGLDSTKYPLRNYGDLAFRIYGNWARILCNVLQSFQFFLNVSLLIVSNGQGLSQMAAGQHGNGYLCFVLAEVIFMLTGFLLGQIRTLQRLGWLANLAVWLNVICIIMTMAVVYVYPPNYSASETTYGTPPNEPIETYANWPPGTGLNDRITGLMQGVFSYGGATLFNELMAEMRRPYDFWKGLLCAETFIVSVYLIMGMVVYSAQGQYSYNPAYQGISDTAYAWQTLGNAINFISGLIAALLYGNIGAKVFYASVLRDVFHLPALDQKKGKWIWVALIPIYWSAAFVIAGAIPQVTNLSAFVGAACILQFSYTFPPILMVGFETKKDAMMPDEGFDPRTGEVIRHDDGFKRWTRGYMKKWHINTANVLYFLGALCVAGLGIYASVISMHESFTTTPVTSFTCTNPAG